MNKNYDFLDLNGKKGFDSERVLLSLETINFSSRGDTRPLQLAITQTKLFLVHKDVIQRELLLAEIDALTVSNESNELVLHAFEDTDERLSFPKNKSEVVKMILYLRTVRKSGQEEAAAGRLRVYLVPDLSLDIYLTTDDDLEEGHVMRPDEKYCHLVSYKDFFELEKIFEKKKEEKQKKTKTIYAPAGKKAVTVDDFELLKTLGRGAHGKVLCCERKGQPGERYAMKIIKKQHIIDSNQLEHTMAEKAILSCLDHPFLVSLKYAFQNETKIYFVMEFMRGGELFQHLKRVKAFTEAQTRFICACLVTSLGRLHNEDYIYRDLKPENVLLDERGYAKLTDFGLAKSLAVSDVAKTFCGTPEYLAPEVILDKGCNRPADWWSLGILIYEMMFGIPPFYSRDVQEMYKNTIVNPLKFKARPKVSDEAKDFIAGLLVKAPAKRLGSVADSLEVMSHPWFKDFDWCKLLDKKLVPPYNPNEKDWEKNFDPGFMKEVAKDSICSIDPKVVLDYESQFKLFDYDADEVDLELNDEADEAYEDEAGHSAERNAVLESQGKSEKKDIEDNFSHDKRTLSKQKTEEDLLVEKVVEGNGTANQNAPEQSSDSYVCYLYPVLLKYFYK